jgi:hypothetical protein
MAWGLLGMSRTLKIYEFRVLNWAGNILKATQEAHLSDTQAVRSARLVATGRPFEVWVGTKCIHPVALTPPGKPTDVQSLQPRQRP